MDMVYGPDGNLYVSSSHNYKIYRYNGETGALIDEFVPNTGLYKPTRMTFGPDGNLYTLCGDVKRYNGTTGGLIDTFSAEYGNGLRFGPAGNLYLAGTWDQVKVVDGQTGTTLDSSLFNVGGVRLMDATFRETDPVTLAYTTPYSPPINGDGGLTFKLDLGEILGDGVERTELGALLHSDAYAEASNDMDDDLDEIFRRFVFEREDGLSDPQDVFLNAALTGMLTSQGDGIAGFRATVELLDPATFDILDSSEIAITRDASVYGDGDLPLDGLLFGALATLTPGEEYLLHASLSATAETGADPNSLAHAWLAHSLDVQLSGAPIPEPSTVSLAAVGLLGLALCKCHRRKRSLVQEKSYLTGGGSVSLRSF
jgi:hypothetical protein